MLKRTDWPTQATVLPLSKTINLQLLQWNFTGLFQVVLVSLLYPLPQARAGNNNMLQGSLVSLIYGKTPFGWIFAAWEVDGEIKCVHPAYKKRNMKDVIVLMFDL